jgi:hypothetical protein
MRQQLIRIPHAIAAEVEELRKKYFAQKEEIQAIKNIYRGGRYRKGFPKFDPEIHLPPELRQTYYKMQQPPDRKTKPYCSKV